MKIGKIGAYHTRLFPACALLGAVTFPPPRNAIDSDEEPWVSGLKPGAVPFEPWCPFPSASAAGQDPGRNLTGANGQACFWFSNGWCVVVSSACSIYVFLQCPSAIGCDGCDGSTRGPIPAFICPATAAEGKCKPIMDHIDSGRHLITTCDTNL